MYTTNRYSLRGHFSNLGRINHIFLIKQGRLGTFNSFWLTNFFFLNIYFKYDMLIPWGTNKNIIQFLLIQKPKERFWLFFLNDLRFFENSIKKKLEYYLKNRKTKLYTSSPNHYMSNQFLFVFYFHYYYQYITINKKLFSL